MRKRFYLIHNPKAGINRRRILRNVLARLTAAGATVTVSSPETRKADSTFAAEAAKSGRYDAIIAAGGDSTIRGAATGLMGRTTPLGVIPVGAGNVLAREIGVSRRADGIANMLLHGKAITAHAAAIEGSPFLTMVGVGFDSRVIGKLSQALKRVLGRVAYGPAIVRTLLSPVPELIAVADGVTYRANWIIVTNVSHYGGAFLLSPESHIGGSELKAVFVRIASNYELIRTLIALCFGTHLKRSNISLVPCSNINISAARSEAIQVDGELCGVTPAVIAEAPLEFRLITPELEGC